jgi:hypothetical protein
VIRDVRHFVTTHGNDIMLPGLRFVLAAIAATILVVVLGFMELVKLQVAQGHSAGLAPLEARFAGLAFAERADWAPVPSPHRRSLETLEPFAGVPLTQVRAGDTAQPARTLVSLRPPIERAHKIAAVAPRLLLAVANVAIERPTGDERVAADAPVTTMAALIPLRGAPAPTTAVTGSVKQETAVMIVSAVTLPAAAPQAAVAPLQEAALVVPVAADVSEMVVDPIRDAPPAAMPLPFPHPMIAALSRDALPLPIPRPAKTFARAPRARPQIIRRRVARAGPRQPVRPARPATPPAAPASSNPFAALFGGLSRK